MSFRDRFYKPALLGLAALLFCAVAQFQSGLNVDRKALGLTKMDPLENAPPVLAFSTVALGSFRGLIANALWIRLSTLQEEDKYFEMVQLSDWITKLQPHMVAVWQFQAWNMAYNISVKFKDPEDRWHWVSRGVELLRDNGLKWNPKETRLYRDLSWLYQHKIGANLDDAHMRYKLRLAQQMQALFGGGRPDFEELIDPTTPEWKERAFKLTNVYKMDPKIMQKVDGEYGPFDWRLPDAQAVYWADLGRIYARPEDQETLRRSIYQSLQQGFFRGGALDKSVTNITEQNFMLWPNLDQVGVVNNAYEKMIEEEKKKPNGLEQNMKTAHKNFLKQAIYLLYEDGRERDARHWFTYLRNLYTNAFVGPEKNMTLDEFAVSQIGTDINETDMNKVQAAVIGLFNRELMCLVRDNDDQAENYANMQRRVWNYYHEKIGPMSDQRLKLKSLGQIQQSVLDKYLDPTNGAPPEVRAIIIQKLHLTPPKQTAAAPPAQATTQ